jgi:hypothetical protein
MEFYGFGKTKLVISISPRVYDDMPIPCVYDLYLPRVCMHHVSDAFHHLLVVVESKAAFTSSGEMMRVPGILAGLKERSQSAYAAPAPKPVDSATGHVRPMKK